MTWHSRLARISLALACLSTVWFLVNLIHPDGPVVLLWATAPAYGPLLTAVFWLTTRSAPLPAGTRRLWRHLIPVPLLITAGQGTQGLDVLRHPEFSPAFIDGHELPLRISIGLATGSDAGSLLRRADLAMYAAKKLPGTAYVHHADRQTTERVDQESLAH